MIFFSCATNNFKYSAIQNEFSETELKLLFAGDIMAHTEITETDFENVLSDVEPLIKAADFSFANFESPVNDNFPQSSYPVFNCHSSYAEKIISSGFNVFSLANNHTNDLHMEGINSTKTFFNSKKTAGIFSTGIKEEQDNPVQFITIEKNNIKILFAAVSEVHNYKTELNLFDYIDSSAEAREDFLTLIKNEKQKSDCDLLVLSFHTAEPEYLRSIEEKSKKFYYSLINSGVDILWINHPHVSKEWEIIHTEDNRQKIIFYSVGNTVSAQRRKPDFKKPDASRDWTGDSFLFSIKIKKTNGGIFIENPEATLITTFITENNNFVVKQLNDSFINSLKEKGNTKWASYLSERKKIMSNIKGKDTWQ